MNRKERFEEIYKEYRKGEHKVYSKKIYGEEVRIERVAIREFIITYYGIKLRVNLEKAEVIEESIEYRADINTRHGSLQDYLYFINSFHRIHIWVVNGRLVNMNTMIPIKRETIKKWNRKSNEFKNLYNKITSLIPRSNLNKEDYFRFIHEPIYEFRRYIKENKLIQGRINKARLEVLE